MSLFGLFIAAMCLSRLRFDFETPVPECSHNNVTFLLVKRLHSSDLDEI